MLYYDIYESDGSCQKWFVGTVAVTGVGDNLITRNNAVKIARKEVKHGYKLHTKMSNRETFRQYAL